MARVTVGGTVCISRSRAVVARLVHTQEAAGSSPASATSPLWGILSPSLHGGLVFAPAFNLPTRPPLLGDVGSSPTVSTMAPKVPQFRADWEFASPKWNL